MILADILLPKSGSKTPFPILSYNEESRQKINKTEKKIKKEKYMFNLLFFDFVDSSYLAKSAKIYLGLKGSLNSEYFALKNKCSMNIKKWMGSS